MNDRRRPNGGISGQAWPSDEGPTKTEPPSDQDVRAALVEVILFADSSDKTNLYASADDVADAILKHPLLGKLLRGGR